LDSLNSPRPGLGGSHHLPPYSIFCVSPPHLHPNGTFSRDPWNGVSKLSRFRLPGLWFFITFRFNLRLGWGLKQTCSSPWDLFNGVLHSTCTYRDRVNSRLLVVGSQTSSLTLGLSFSHNLCYRYPNGSCEVILDIYTSIPFQWFKKHLNAKCLAPTIAFWGFGSLGGLPSPIFGSVSGDLTLPSKWGCNTHQPIQSVKGHSLYSMHLIHHHPPITLCDLAQCIGHLVFPAQCYLPKYAQRHSNLVESINER